METSYLHSFLLVVETGSMAEAARRLNITAAAVAQQIRILEREFDAPLLARAGRTVLPTPAGHRLSQSAPLLLRELELQAGQWVDLREQARAQLDALRGERRGGGRGGRGRGRG